VRQVENFSHRKDKDRSRMKMKVIVMNKINKKI